MNEDLLGVHFTDNDVGVIVGEKGILLWATNGSATWMPLESGTRNDLWSVFFIDQNVGNAVGISGTILRARPAL